MSFHRFKRKLNHFWEAYRVVFYTVVGLCALGYLYYFLTTIGPRSVNSDSRVVAVSAAPSDAVIQSLITEVEKLERSYQLAATADLVTPEAMQSLEAAVNKQKELILMYPNGNYGQSQRLSALETKLDSARAAVTVVRIEQLQKEGEAALTDARYDEAARLLSEGLKLQREVNASNASSRYKNYVRETALLQAIAAIEATPLFEEKEAAVKSAKLAVRDERWGDALAAYIRARDLQGRLNREYTRTRYADLAGYDRLESEISSLNSAGVAAEIDAKENAADTAAKAGDHVLAAKLYGNAFTLQQEVNLNYARSRFVSSPRLDRLDSKRQSALARPLTDRLTAMVGEITADLAGRRVVSAEQRIPEASALLERISTEFPRSDFQTGALKIKLSYLSLKRTDLRALQDDVYEQLLPLPGASGLLMLKTELPQRIYALVMNTNPSRNPGRAFPVDSVNWNDAEDFCTRMSWVLGLKVRLPSVDEFRVAIGDGLTGRMVSADNSDNRTVATNEGELNANGFLDLIGNVAEWLYATSGSTAPVGGGSYLDKQATLKTIPTENRPRIDRARHIGFRFVVVLPDEN